MESTSWRRSRGSILSTTLRSKLHATDLKREFSSGVDLAGYLSGDHETILIYFYIFSYFCNFGVFFIYDIILAAFFVTRIRFMKRIRILDAEMKQVHADSGPQHCSHFHTFSFT